MDVLEQFIFVHASNDGPFLVLYVLYIYICKYRTSING
jgi:hypothetical protein